MKKKNYDEESDKEYFLEAGVRCTKKLHDLHNDLPFSSEVIKIEKFEKYLSNLQDKNWIWLKLLFT